MADTKVNIQLSADGSQVRNEIKLIDQQLQQLGNNTQIPQLNLGAGVLPISQQHSTQQQQNTPQQRQRDRIITRLYREFLIMRRELQTLNRNIPNALTAIQNLVSQSSQVNSNSQNQPNTPVANIPPALPPALPQSLNSQNQPNTPPALPQSSNRDSNNPRNSTGYIERNFNILSGRMTRMLGVLSIIAFAQHAAQMDYDRQKLAYQTYGSLGTDTNYSAAARRSTEWGKNYGFDYNEVLPTIQANQSTAGFISLAAQQRDITSILAASRAYNIDSATLASASGRMTATGTFRIGEQQKFANMLAKSIKENNMQGREREQLSVLESINANLANRSTTVTTDMMSSVMNMYNAIAGINPNMRGERGGQLATSMVDIANSKDTGLDILAGLGTKYTGIKGEMELRKLAETDPQRYYKQVWETLKGNYGEEEGGLIFMRKLMDMGMSYTKAETSLQAVKNGNGYETGAFTKGGQDEGEDEITKRIKGYQATTMATLDKVEITWNNFVATLGEGINSLKAKIVNALDINTAIENLTKGLNNVLDLLGLTNSGTQSVGETALEVINTVKNRLDELLKEYSKENVKDAVEIGGEPIPKQYAASSNTLTPYSTGITPNESLSFQRLGAGAYNFIWGENKQLPFDGESPKGSGKPNPYADVGLWEGGLGKAFSGAVDKVSFNSFIPKLGWSFGSSESSDSIYKPKPFIEDVKNLITDFIDWAGGAKRAHAAVPGKPEPKVKGAYYNAETGEFSGIEKPPINLRTAYGLRNAPETSLNVSIPKANTILNKKLVNSEETQISRRLTENTNRNLSDNTEALQENTKRLAKGGIGSGSTEEERSLLTLKENLMRVEHESLKSMYESQSKAMDAVIKAIDAIIKALPNSSSSDSNTSIINSEAASTTGGIYVPKGESMTPDQFKGIGDKFIGYYPKYGVVGCVESTTLMGQQFSKFYQANSDLINVDDLRQRADKAGILQKYDKNKIYPAGTTLIIKHGGHSHAIIADGKGGYYGNSSYPNGSDGYGTKPHIVHNPKPYYITPDYVALTGQGNDLLDKFHNPVPGKDYSSSITGDVNIKELDKFLLNARVNGYSKVTKDTLPEARKNALKIIAESKRQGVDPRVPLIKGLMESSLQHNISDSSKGAIGLMQLMPETAKGLGVNPRNLDENIRGGISYYKKMLKYFNGNVELAVAAYNAGPGAVQKYGGVPPYRETQNYVKNFNNLYPQTDAIFKPKTVTVTANNVDITSNNSTADFSKVNNPNRVQESFIKNQDTETARAVKGVELKPGVGIDPITGQINNGAGYNYNRKSFAIGIKNVPYDLYPANLHKGERVLTKLEAKELRDLDGLAIPEQFKINEEVDSLPEIKRKRALQERYKEVTQYTNSSKNSGFVNKFNTDYLQNFNEQLYGKNPYFNAPQYATGGTIGGAASQPASAGTVESVTHNNKKYLKFINIETGEIKLFPDTNEGRKQLEEHKSQVLNQRRETNNVSNQKLTTPPQNQIQEKLVKNLDGNGYLNKLPPEVISQGKNRWPMISKSKNPSTTDTSVTRATMDPVNPDKVPGKSPSKNFISKILGKLGIGSDSPILNPKPTFNIPGNNRGSGGILGKILGGNRGEGGILGKIFGGNRGGGLLSGIFPRLLSKINGKDIGGLFGGGLPEENQPQDQPQEGGIPHEGGNQGNLPDLGTFAMRGGSKLVSKIFSRVGGGIFGKLSKTIGMFSGLLGGGRGSGLGGLLGGLLGGGKKGGGLLGGLFKGIGGLIGGLFGRKKKDSDVPGNEENPENEPVPGNEENPENEPVPGKDNGESVSNKEKLPGKDKPKKKKKNFFEKIGDFVGNLFGGKKKKAGGIPGKPNSEEKLPRDEEKIVTEGENKPKDKKKSKLNMFEKMGQAVDDAGDAVENFFGGIFGTRKPKNKGVAVGDKGSAFDVQSDPLGILKKDSKTNQVLNQSESEKGGKNNTTTINGGSPFEIKVTVDGDADPKYLDAFRQEIPNMTNEISKQFNFSKGGKFMNGSF